MSRIPSYFDGAEATSTRKAIPDRSKLYRMPLGIVCVLAFVLTCGAASAGNSAFHRFDGTYRGSSLLVKGFGYVCGNSDQTRSLAIVNGRFDYPFQIGPLKIRQVPVKISADGSFTAYRQYGTGGEKSDYVPGVATITGHITGKTLQATASNMACYRNILLRRN